LSAFSFISFTKSSVLTLELASKQVESAAELIKKVAQNSKLPYFTLTPTFSVCPTHGYTNGEHKVCPTCGANCEVYSRVVGYLRPVDQWNDGKQAEFAIRKTFDRSTIMSTAPLTT